MEAVGGGGAQAVGDGPVARDPLTGCGTGRPPSRDLRRLRCEGTSFLLPYDGLGCDGLLGGGGPLSERGTGRTGGRRGPGPLALAGGGRVLVGAATSEGGRLRAGIRARAGAGGVERRALPLPGGGRVLVGTGRAGPVPSDSIRCGRLAGASRSRPDGAGAGRLTLAGLTLAGLTLAGLTLAGLTVT